MAEATIESGFATVAAGSWLSGQGQPAAFEGAVTVKGLKGFVVPDRAAVVSIESTGTSSFARADAPFLTRLDALPDEPLKVVSTKLLLAPLTSRIGAKALKLVPFSFQRALPVTQLKFGWAVMATKSRTKRISIEESETLSVRPEALVAWIGKDPTGFCPRLSVWDMLLPRGPKNLVFSFHGPCVMWIEGSGIDAARTPRRRGFGRMGGRA